MTPREENPLKSLVFEWSLTCLLACRQLKHAFHLKYNPTTRPPFRLPKYTNSVLFVTPQAIPAVLQLLLQRTVDFLHDPSHIFQSSDDVLNALGLFKEQQAPSKINCAIPGQVHLVHFSVSENGIGRCSIGDHVSVAAVHSPCAIFKKLEGTYPPDHAASLSRSITNA